MNVRIGTVLSVLALSAITANAQAPTSEKATSTTRTKTATSSQKSKMTTKTYSGCLKGDATAGYTLGTTGANAMTYNVMAAPDSSNVDFTSGVNKRVEIVTTVDPNGDTQMTQGSSNANGGNANGGNGGATNSASGAAGMHAGGNAHQLSVRSIRVVPGTCDAGTGTNTTRSKTSTKTTTNP
jgi:hypothetical protein